MNTQEHVVEYLNSYRIFRIKAGVWRYTPHPGGPPDFSSDYATAEEAETSCRGWELMQILHMLGKGELQLKRKKTRNGKKTLPMGFTVTPEDQDKFFTIAQKWALTNNSECFREMINFVYREEVENKRTLEAG